MSVQFHFPDGTTMDLANGVASTLLHALGYPVTEDSDGEMPVATALAAVRIVKDVSLPEDWPAFLADFEAVARACAKAGQKTVRWS